jgi:2-phospho-L-lactate guanylyltransferase
MTSPGGVEPSLVHALVPLKRFDRAKARLANALTQEERGALMQRLLATVIEALEAAQVGRITLVTAEVAIPAGIERWDDRGLPWNEALEHAAADLVSLPVVAFVSADLPRLQSADIVALLAAVPSRGIAVARANDGGTNAVAMRPPGAMRTRFGEPGSAEKHADTARAIGLDAAIVDRPGLAFDLDTPEDLTLAADEPESHPDAPA